MLGDFTPTAHGEPCSTTGPAMHGAYPTTHADSTCPFEHRGEDPGAEPPSDDAGSKGGMDCEREDNGKVDSDARLRRLMCRFSAPSSTEGKIRVQSPRATKRETRAE